MQIVAVWILTFFKALQTDGTTYIGSIWMAMWK